MAQDRSRPMRSWLFTPATRPDRFAKAAEAGADVLIIDLEDAVAPADKPRARAAALEHLAIPAEAGPLRALRVNGLDTWVGLADLDALLGSAAAPDILVLPKAEGSGHLRFLDRPLTAAGKAARLVGIVESARGQPALPADRSHGADPRHPHPHGLFLLGVPRKGAQEGYQ